MFGWITLRSGGGSPPCSFFTRLLLGRTSLCEAICGSLLLLIRQVVGLARTEAELVNRNGERMVLPHLLDQGVVRVLQHGGNVTLDAGENTNNVVGHGVGDGGLHL